MSARPAPRLAPFLAAAGLLLAAPGAAPAQVVSAAVRGVDTRHIVYYHRTAYEQSGTVTGASAALRIWRVRLSLDEGRGTLRADGGLPNSDVRLRDEAAGLRLELPWGLAVGATREVRRFTSDAGTSDWVLRGTVIEIEPAFGLPGLRGIAGLTVLSGGVRDGPKLTEGFRAALGLSYRPRGIPASLRLSYRFERFDIAPVTADPATARFEEFHGLVLEVVAPAR